MVADFNGDGMPDFAVVLASPSNSVIDVGLQQPGNQFQMVTTTLPIQVSIAWAGDLNGDGLPDLVLITSCLNTPCSTVYTLLNTGNGTFGSPVPIAANIATLVAVADFNHDGKPDLALSSVQGCGTRDGPAVLLGNGDGTFGSPICLAAPTPMP